MELRDLWLLGLLVRPKEAAVRVNYAPVQVRDSVFLI